MTIVWSLPIWGKTLASTRGDVVRARHLIAALRRAGHKVHVVARTSDEGAPSASDVMAAGYRSVLRRMLPRTLALALRDVTRYANSRAFGRRVAAEARRRDADAIIETQINCAVSGAVAARLTGLPLVVDDCSPSDEEIEIGSGLPVLATRALLEQGDAAAVVVATSGSVRERLIAEGIPKEKVRLIRNGVDIDAFERADGAAARAPLGLSDRVVFGFVGSFLEWHRAELMIEALARLPDAARAQALLVGTGPFLEATLARAEDLGVTHRVTSVGAVPPEQVPELIAAFDVGVLPDTLDYGNPMKLTEYAAAGIPALAPNRPSVREILRDGETGVLFAPQDVGSLAAAMERLAADGRRRREIGARARRDVAASAVWSMLAERLIDGLEDPPATGGPAHAPPSGAADAAAARAGGGDADPDGRGRD